MVDLSIKIKNIFKDNDDLIIIKKQYDDVHVAYFGLNTLINFPSTFQEIDKKFLAASFHNELPLLIKNLGKEIKKIEEIQNEILTGNLVIQLDKSILSIQPTPRTLERSIEAPFNESVLSGPRISFNEDLITNLGQMRKQLNTNLLVMKNFTVGKEQSNQLTVIYLKEKANIQLVNSILEQIKRKQKKNVHTIQELVDLLDFPKWSIIPNYHMTEIPLEAAQNLTKGKVLLMIDRIPFALILPSLFTDLIYSENDRNLLFPFMLIARLLRITGILIAVLVPGLYVALVAVNPEVLRIELALSVAQSREGVPYPALLEVLLMLLVLELILEASVRLPKSIGPTITMVGGIILGQAVVEAKLVSNLLIIILAATMIANSTVIGFQNSISIRFFKYVVLILASIYGILGILAGIFICFSYLASIKTFNIPYLKLKMEKDDLSNG